MPAEPSRDSLDTERLSTYLKALANPSRLELLWLLRVPRQAAEIELRPTRRDGGLSQERAMSRQSVLEHLESLEEIGVVERLPDEESKRVISQPRIFAILEEMRTLTALRPAVRVDVDATLDTGGSEGAVEWPTGRKLVLVSGPWEGRAFPLSGAGPWALGRAREGAVALTYDPYVHTEHARLAAKDGRLFLEPSEGTRNPVRVNFQPVRAPRPLVSGDILGVGRSLLVFQDA